jgi:hypothetical protein
MFMTWDEVKLKIVFWSSGAWVPDSNFQPGTVADPAKIMSLLEQWYNGYDGSGGIAKRLKLRTSVLGYIEPVRITVI